MTRLIEVPFSKSFASKFRLVDEFFRSQKKLSSCSSIHFLSTQLLIVAMQTAGKKVHGMVLVYHLTSRQPPICVFNDGLNLSVCRNLNIVV